MCQPGRPRPQGASQAVSSPAFCAFHSAKSSGSRLQRRALDALALVHVVDRAVRQLAVARVRAHVEVDVAVDRVGVAALDQRLDQLDDLVDRLARERLVVGAAEPEAVGVGDVGGGHLARELLARHARPRAPRRRSCR